MQNLIGFCYSTQGYKRVPVLRCVVENRMPAFRSTDLYIPYGTDLVTKVKDGTRSYRAQPEPILP